MGPFYVSWHLSNLSQFMVTTVFFWEPVRLCVSPREKATGIQLKIFALLAARLHSMARVVHGAGFWRCWCSCAPGIELELETQQGQKVTGTLYCAAEDRWLTAIPFPPHCCSVYTLTNNNKRTLWKTFAFVVFIVQSLFLLLNCIMS